MYNYFKVLISYNEGVNSMKKTPDALIVGAGDATGGAIAKNSPEKAILYVLQEEKLTCSMSLSLL